MHVWIVTVGEPLPIDGPNERLHRHGMLAGFLQQRGHSVTWWTSTFNHFTKTNRADHDIVANISDTYQIRMLHSPGYKGNISWQRLVDHKKMAQRFAAAASSQPSPDVIIASFPTIDLCMAATDYGRTRHVPVTLDIRDLWPDIFLYEVPHWARGAAKVVLTSMYAATRTACRQAAALTGITQGVVDWGLRYADRPATTFDQYYPLSYSGADLPVTELMAARTFWDDRYVGKAGDFTVCYIGNLGRLFVPEFMALFEAARQLRTTQPRLKFVICGNGDNLERYRAEAADCPNVMFTGRVGAAHIRALMERAQMGLLPYESRIDFSMSIPNKVAEYLSGSLPIISSLQGVLSNLLAQNDCGVTYTNASAQDLAAKLSAVADDPTRLAAMARNARSLFLKRFVAENVYNDMVTYLEDLAASGRA